MDEKIWLKRGRSRKMKNWGLACSLDSKEHTGFTTQPSGLCPSGARMLSVKAGYPLEGALASPAPYRVLLLSDSRPTPTVVCVLVLPGPLAALQLWGHPCPTVFSAAC